MRLISCTSAVRSAGFLRQNAPFENVFGIIDYRAELAPVLPLPQPSSMLVFLWMSSAEFRLESLKVRGPGTAESCPLNFKMHARHLEMLSCTLGFCNSQVLLMLHVIDDTLNKETAVVMLPRFMSWKIKVPIAQCHPDSY